MVTEPNALREHLAYELLRWGGYASYAAAQAAADAVIAALLAGGTLVPVTHHPMTEWIANHFIVHWPEAAFGLAAA